MIKRSAITEKGFSLVELMISLALGSIVTLGVIQLFVANSDTYTLLQGQSRMQESARFGLAFIGRSVRSAGYRGCFSSNDELHSTLLAPGEIMQDLVLPYEYDLRFGVVGHNATGLAQWQPPISGSEILRLPPLPRTIDGIDTNVFTTPGGDGAGNGINTDAITSGTDILTLRNMSPVDARLVANLATSDEPVVVGVPTGGLEFEEDHLAVIHDCEKATIFRITGINTAGNQATILHDIADVDSTKNYRERLAIVNTFLADAAVSAIETNTFFIAPGAGLNSSGNAPLSLWRKTGIDPPVELVEGVEDLQVVFGEDTDSDGFPNIYTNLVNDWTRVKTVRVTLVVNSIDDVGATTVPTHGCAVQGCITGQAVDGLLRRAFTQTFQLRNHG